MRIRTGQNITFLLVAVTLLSGLAAVQFHRAVDIGERRVKLIIEPGDSLTEVAAFLAQEGVIPSRFWFVYPARAFGIDRRLTPGRYDFTGGNSCRSVLRRLERGDIEIIRLTIPEGAPIWRTAAVVADRMDLDSAAFVALNSDSAFLAELGLPCLEGYLFPETYYIPWGQGERDVARRLVQMFRAQADSLLRAGPLPNNLTPDEIVILASIVEAETRLEGERAMVASVYHNRLSRKMKLDADPTVIYAMGGLSRPLLRKDLDVASPYNTYRRKGLPPTPINSPGLAALKAALAPDSSDFLFFVADRTGGHRFSKSYAEHLRAIRQIRSGS